MRTISPVCFDYSEETFSFNGLTSCKNFDYPWRQISFLLKTLLNSLHVFWTIDSKTLSQVFTRYLLNQNYITNEKQRNNCKLYANNGHHIREHHKCWSIIIFIMIRHFSSLKDTTAIPAILNMIPGKKNCARVVFFLLTSFHNL